MRRWAKKAIIKRIKELYQMGIPINSGYIQKNYADLYSVAVRHFAGWQNAVVVSGFNYLKIRLRQPGQRWTREKIISVIKARRRRGLYLHATAVPTTLYHAAGKVFGRRGWRKALHQVGISSKSLDPRLKWTKDRVQKEILRLHRIGTPLNLYYLQRNNYTALISASRKFFRNWRKAIRSVGLSYAKIRVSRKNWWTRGRVIYYIRRLARAGVRLSPKDIRYSRKRFGLFDAAIRHFGSWSQAVEAAGIDYKLHLRTWSTKAWIRKLSPADTKKIQERVYRVIPTSTKKRR